MHTRVFNLLGVAVVFSLILVLVPGDVHGAAQRHGPEQADDSLSIATSSERLDTPPAPDRSDWASSERASAPAAPVDALNVEFVARLDGLTEAVFVEGDHAYIGDGARLSILDVANPAAPVVLATTEPFSNTIEDIYVDDGYAYVATGEGGGLEIVNVSDPAQPAETGFYAMAPTGAPNVYIRGVAVSDDAAMVVSRIFADMLDVSDPSEPDFVWGWELGSALDVAVCDGIFYVANGKWGLVSTDGADYDTLGNAYDVAVDGDTAYAATGFGLELVDVGGPTATGLGGYDTLEAARGVDVSGSTAYVAAGAAGLRVIDARDLSAPWEVGFYSLDWPAYAHDVSVSGSTAYVAAGTGGLFILRYTGGGLSSSISGHVRDRDSGSPISGVTVLALGSSSSGTTDASGAYAITDLAPGSYTLLPSKEGWSFSPGIRQLSVPPDAIGQDFVGIRFTPEPTPRGALQLHMSDAVSHVRPVRPSATVSNENDTAADYDLVMQLWSGFSMLDEITREASFASSGSKRFAFDFGIVEPGNYYIWAELWRDDQRLQAEYASFTVGEDYRKLHAAATDLTETAYGELNECEDIAVDALAQGAATGTKEAVSFLTGKLSGAALQLGDLTYELTRDVLASAAVEMTDWALKFRKAIELGTYDGAARFFREDLDRDTFDQRNDSVRDAEDSLLGYAGDHAFTWEDWWQSEVVRRRWVIRNQTETVLGRWPKVDFTAPYVRGASLTEMKRSFDRINDGLLEWLATAIKALLIALAVLVALAWLISIGLTGGATAAALAPLVSALTPIVSSIWYGFKGAKIVIVFVLLVLLALTISMTAQDTVSPQIVQEHGDAMTLLQAYIEGVTTGRSVQDLRVSAETQGYEADVTVELAGGGPSWLETQLFRGDGRLMDIADYGVASPGSALGQSVKLPPGSYWVVAVAHGKDQIRAERSSFHVASSAVTLELAVADQQISLGDPIEATLTLTNQDVVTGTGTLVLSAMTLSGEGLEIWLPELGPGETASYAHTFVPQAEGGLVLRAAVGDDFSTLATVDRACVVGDGPSVSLDLSPQASYPPDDDVVWTVTAVNAGTQPTTTRLTLNTYGGGLDYTLEHGSSQTLTLGVGVSTTLDLTALSGPVPGSYTAHLLLGDQLYRAEDFLVEAQGSLFPIASAEPSAVSVSDLLTVTVDVQDELYAATNASVTVSLRAPDGQVVDLPLAQTATGRYESTYSPGITGTYVAEVTASKPGYATGFETTFFTAGDASLLLVETDGEPTLNVSTQITFTLLNEYASPIPGATVIVSGTDGLITAQSDEAGVASVLVRPVVTDSLMVRAQKNGFADTSLQLPVSVVSDTVAPALVMALPEITNQSTLTVTGLAEADAAVQVEGQSVSVDSRGRFSATVSLLEGVNLLSATALDTAGNATTVTDTVDLDTVPPTLTVTYPPDALVTTLDVIQVTGKTEMTASVAISDTLVPADQGDGSFGAWILLKPGANAIPITASDAAQNSTVMTRTVQRAIPAQAAFSAAPTEGIAPLTVDFGNLSSGDYDTCRWQFGDGGESTDCAMPSHEYASSGTYTVTLTVSGLGGSDTVTRSDLITVYEAVAAGFTASPTSGTPPLTVDFANTSTGDYDTHVWHFGDGVTSTLESPTHTYTALGSYTVTLSIQGPGGTDAAVKPGCVTVEPFTVYLPLVTRKEGAAGKHETGW